MNKEEWEKYVAENKRRHRERVAETTRFYRLLRRKTIRELAEAAGCAPDTIWRIENKRSEARTETEHRIAAALGVPWLALVSNPPQKPEDVPKARFSSRSGGRKKKKGR